MPKLTLSVGDILGKLVLERGWVLGETIDEKDALNELKTLGINTNGSALPHSSGYVTEVKPEFFGGIFRQKNGDYVRISLAR